MPADKFAYRMSEGALLRKAQNTAPQVHRPDGSWAYYQGAVDDWYYNSREATDEEIVQSETLEPEAAKPGST